LDFPIKDESMTKRMTIDFSGKVAIVTGGAREGRRSRAPDHGERRPGRHWARARASYAPT
jgi:hypothetical protein